MNTLNLFKNIKNISYVTAFACLPLSSAHGTEPKDIIEAYANDKILLGTESLAGNVLAYKNIEGKTVVLKSGIDFIAEKKEKDVIVVSLEEVVKYTTGSNDASSKNSNSAIGSFGDYCKKNNDAWYTYISSKDPYDAFPREDPIKYIQNNGAQTLHGRLGNFRHTEIQVQALWKKYESLDPAKGCSIPNNALRQNLEKLLPVALTGKKKKNKTQAPDHKIYSLFEACDACEKTNWLQNKKGIFMFAILDGQFTKNGKYKVKDKEAKKPEEEKVVFMSQKALEDKKIKGASDLGEDFTKL